MKGETDFNHILALILDLQEICQRLQRTTGHVGHRAEDISVRQGENYKYLVLSY